LVQNLDYSKTKEDLEIVAQVNMIFLHWFTGLESSRCGSN
jgi:hypothetical protein